MHGAIPAEIITQILYYVPAEDNLRSFQCLSRRFHRLANEPLVWRYHCRADYRFWREDHDFRGKLARPAAEVDWKRLWMLRRHRNERAARILNGILATKQGRLEKWGRLGWLGYDVKDFLLEQSNCGEEMEDVLARRYYASVALGTIHRAVAVREWAKLQRSPTAHSRQLARAFGGFDMFVLYDQEGDLDDIEEVLDKYSREFLDDHRSFSELTTRRKALALLRWARARGLTGMDNPSQNYRQLRCCLIGRALLGADGNHRSLPIVSSAIYCSLAQRVGLHAESCAFPAHVHTVVSAPPGETLDGGRRMSPPTVDLDTMILDPYGSDDEVSLVDLRLRLDNLGMEDVWLGRFAHTASTTNSLLRRAAMNILASCDLANRSQLTNADLVRSGFTKRDVEALMYASFWSQLLSTPAADPQWSLGLRHFMAMYFGHFPEDTWLLEEQFVPLYNVFVDAHERRGTGLIPGAAVPAGPTIIDNEESVPEILAIMRNLDARGPTVSRRYRQDIRDDLRFRVGQVIRHRRYGFTAVVYGWSIDGPTGLPNQSGVFGLLHGDGLESGSSDDGGGGVRKPSRRIFYACLHTEDSTSIVAQHNMQLVTDPTLVPASLFRNTGRFFKRFDPKTCTFVSNVEEFFPDD